MKIVNKTTQEEFEVTGQVNTKIDCAVLSQDEIDTFMSEENYNDIVFTNYSFVDTNGEVFTTSLVEGINENKEFKLTE